MAGRGAERLSLAVAVARYYLRPVRREVGRLRTRSAQLTWGVRVGPAALGEHVLVLRTPRFDDAVAWREARLRERARIEPWWADSPQTWEERHSESAWVTGLLHARAEARAGRALPLVIEIDGELAGEANLEWIAPHTSTAELSVWVDSRWVRKGASGVAGRLLYDYAFDRLGLHRLIAPIATGNVGAALGARRMGMVKEGTMAGFLEVGGERRDHDLWALTADRYRSPNRAQ